MASAGNGRELRLTEHGHESATIGFSRTPTLYRITWRDGNQEFLRCGADILLNGLQADLVGEARCPVCGNGTRLVVAGGRIDELEPRDALLHVVEVPMGPGRIRIECESTHIFDKESCFQNWISNYHGRKGLVTSIEGYQKKIVEAKVASRQAQRYGPLREEVEQ